MGRGNTCVLGEYEGLYYIDWDNFSTTWEDGNGRVYTDDYENQRQEWEEALCEFKCDLKKRFKSLSECKEWIGVETLAVLENKLFYVAVEDNVWSMAIKLIQKEQSYYSDGNIANLQKGLYQKYLKGIKECLFLQFEELGVYGGAWTYGTIKKSA